MIRSILYAITFYLLTVAMLIGGLWLLLAPRSWAMAGLKLHGRIATWLLWVVCGTRIEVRGRERLPKAPYLVVAKHQSAWDTFALVPLFDDVAIVLKDELKWIPIYGWFCVKFEHILVKRDRAAVALKALVADGRARAACGREILIFPEGTRRAPGAPPDYKPGYVALYEGLQVPCVPLALNSGLYWPRRSLRRYPGTIVVEFLEPLPAGQSRALFRRDVEARIEAASARLMAEALAGPLPPPFVAVVAAAPIRSGP
ncbi:MAG: lysophospholipid acyltransferase family protein [Hyphomicrobiaceae bacterium]